MRRYQRIKDSDAEYYSRRHKKIRHSTAHRFNGLAVMVTGGARGIGRELAIKLVAKGADVIIVGRDQNQLDAMVAKYGASITAIAAHLSNPATVDHLIATLTGQNIRLAGLFNNAASQTEMDFFVEDRTSSAQGRAPRSVSIWMPRSR